MEASARRPPRRSAEWMSGTMEHAPIQRSPAEWRCNGCGSARSLVVLSGMSTMAQVEEDLRLCRSFARSRFQQWRAGVDRKSDGAVSGAHLVPWNRCNYCMPCRMAVDIPATSTTSTTRHPVRRHDGWRRFRYRCFCRRSSGPAVHRVRQSKSLWSAEDRDRGVDSEGSGAAGV